MNDCPEGYQKEEYSVLFNIFIMNPAEGLQMHFLSLHLYGTKKHSAPRGADAVKCTNPALMVGSFTSMSSFSEIRNPCALMMVRALYQRSYSVARGVTYTHLGFQLKSPSRPDLKSLDSNSSKRLDPWSLDLP